jgi:hypothetical protein
MAEKQQELKLDPDTGIKIPDDQKSHDDWAPNAAETRAMTGGWRPEHDWEGAPEDWVNARDFNFRGELMARITKQGRTLGTVEAQLQQAREMIAASDRVTQKLIKDAVDQTRRDLRAQKRAAQEDDDHIRVEQIEDELDDLKVAQSEIKTVAATPVPDTGQRQPTPVEAAWFTFVTGTPWAQDPQYNVPLLAHAEAVRNANPTISVGDFLESVMEKGKELRGLKRPAAPSPGGNDDNKGGNRRPAKRGTKGFSAADLNEQQRFIGQGYVDDGTCDSLDAYATDLGEIGGLGGQR